MRDPTASASELRAIEKARRQGYEAGYEHGAQMGGIEGHSLVACREGLVTIQDAVACLIRAWDCLPDDGGPMKSKSFRGKHAEHKSDGWSDGVLDGFVEGFFIALAEEAGVYVHGAQWTKLLRDYAEVVHKLVEPTGNNDSPYDPDPADFADAWRDREGCP